MGVKVGCLSRRTSGRCTPYKKSHALSADTVAHNKYVPRQITLTQTTMNFGHLYWELRADSTIGPHPWQQLRGLLDDVFVEHERSLSCRLTDTLLPFAVNWRLFYRMNRFMSRRVLRRVLKIVERVEDIPPEFRHVGAEVEMKSDTGESRMFLVTRIADDEVTIDIFGGPSLAFEKVDDAVRVTFLPWHRAWTHSLFLVLLLGVVGWMIEPVYGLVMALAALAHILEDQMGFMGTNLLFPLTRKRRLGWKWFRSGDRSNRRHLIFALFDRN